MKFIHMKLEGEREHWMSEMFKKRREDKDKNKHGQNLFAREQIV